MHVQTCELIALARSRDLRMYTAADTMRCCADGAFAHAYDAMAELQHAAPGDVPPLGDAAVMHRRELLCVAWTLMSTLCAHFPWRLVLPVVMSPDLAVYAAFKAAGMSLLTSTCRPLPGAECLILCAVLEIIDPRPDSVQRSAAQYCSIFAHAEALAARGRTDLYRELPIELGMVRRSKSGLLGHPCLAAWECANAPVAAVGCALREHGEPLTAVSGQQHPEGQVEQAVVPRIDGSRFKVRLARPPSSTVLIHPRSPRILPFGGEAVMPEQRTAVTRPPLAIQDRDSPPHRQDGKVRLLHAPCIALITLMFSCARPCLLTIVSGCTAAMYACARIPAASTSADEPLEHGKWADRFRMCRAPRGAKLW